MEENQPESNNEVQGYLKHPHDRVIRETLSDPEEARAFLQLTLPPELTEKLELTKVKYEKETFIEESLREHRSDLLFTVPLKQAAGKSEKQTQVYILFEHKSSPDDELHFQLLGYILEIYKNQRKTRKFEVGRGKETESPTKKNSKAKLLPVIPLVLLQVEGNWQPASLVDLFAIDAEMKEQLTKYIPSFVTEIYDLREKDLAELTDKAFIYALLRIMKSIRKKGFAEELARVMELFQSVFIEEKKGLEKLHKLLYYIYSAGGEDLRPETVNDITIKKIGKRAEGAIMTIAEKIYQEGKLEGIEQGIEKGKLEGKLEGQLETERETLQLQLELRFGKLTPVEINLIQKCGNLSLLKEGIKAFARGENKDKILSYLE